MTVRYDHDVVVFAWFTLGWLSTVLVSALRSLALGDKRSVSFVYVVFFFFFAVPLALDLTVGPPQYTYQRGFIVSQFDRDTNLWYLAYLALVPVVFRLVGGPPRRAGRVDAPLPLTRNTTIAAWLAMLALPIALVFAPAPSAYLRYAAYVGDVTSEHRESHAIVLLTATLAVVAGAMVLSAPGSRAAARLLTIPFILVGVWIHGKRSIVALALLVVLYRLWSLGVLRGRRFLLVAALTAGGFGLFSYGYQASLRRVEQRARPSGMTSSPYYLNYRIDFGRDDVTKQTIFAELNPRQLQILEYRGQSLLFDLTFFVPRRLWPAKPQPYAVYATSAMFMTKPKDYGWGITTSWLDEAIANAGWAGLLLGPLVPALVCRTGDRRRSAFAGLLTVAVASLTLVLHFIAFMPLFLMWLAMVLRPGATRRRRPGRPALRRPLGPMPRATLRSR